MLNNNTKIKIGDTSQVVSFNNTSTGHLQKSNSYSRFINFKESDPIKENIFPNNTKPFIICNKYPYSKINIIVLQILIFGDNQYLCEIIEENKLK